jgi:hypothetical protein
MRPRSWCIAAAARYFRREKRAPISGMKRNSLSETVGNIFFATAATFFLSRCALHSNLCS